MVADQAALATNAVNVNGFDATFVSEALDHFDFDRGGPPNLDPSEGPGDPDGDGIANFVDRTTTGEGSRTSTRWLREAISTW